VRQLVFAPDGKFLICAMDADWKKYDETSSRRAAEIHIWDAATRQPACKPIELWGEVPQLAFTSDGTLQTLDMTTSSHGLATSWDVRTGQPIGSPQKCKRPIREWSYSPDGRHVMAGNGEDNTGFLYRVDVSSLDAPLHFAVGTIQPSGGVSTSMFSPDSSLVVTAGGTAWVWDVATLKPIGPSFGQANAVAFSPDGKWILTGSSDGNARLWRVPTVVEGDIERITLWVQVNTGAELVQTSRRILRADDWQKKQQRLEELGGPPDMSR
jgi:WD40 repeat protein